MNAPASRDLAAQKYLDVKAVGKAFRGTSVVSGMDFRVAQGELVSLLGPSGCGKTTLLRIIAGLTPTDEGEVFLDGQNITTLPPHRRNISVVFQSYALFPHLSVAENVAFGLRARGIAKSVCKPKVSEALALVRMSEFADRRVAALSGGQQQRVAVARALIVDPALLLLDEPFSALDRKLRETMQVELKTLLRDKGITAIFVTHDQDEAMGVSDRIAVMNAGQIEQFETPAALYAKPASAFVMDFVGQSTRLSGQVVDSQNDWVKIRTAYGVITAPGALAPGKKVTVGVRPELIRPEPGENSLEVTLADAMVLGAKTQIHGRAKEGDRLLCELPGMSTGLEPGSCLTLGWAASDTQVYEADP